MNKKIWYSFGVVMFLVATVIGITVFIPTIFDDYSEDTLAQEELAQRYEKLQEENQALSQELAELIETMEDSDKIVDHYEEEIDKLEEEHKRLQLEIDRLQTEKDHLKKGTDNNRENYSPSGDKIAYLTFDDGPSHNTEQILDILKEHDIPATFFVNGNDTSFGHKMYQRMVNEGHAIGNHTYTHNYDKIYSSPEDFMEDFYELEELLDRVIGVKPEIMRFPGGSKSASALDVAGYDIIEDIIEKLEEENYAYVDWNVTSGDASTPPLSKEKITENVISGAKNQEEAVILFHDSAARETTVEALPQVISKLQEMGFAFDILSKSENMVQFSR
ncbi:polysaccharide deacetylase family protein [Natranaerobius thermophilus]|uniref:Polysaccharide deacetylase n=1 Tax=Natranaerobius thermophilus (strain ATCC BAA-1301 / DSM 18059 / JW/NM-WN-LF) TaxID=457570 RepID=B2A0H4_NATTJ|nr:polysaccharide deacetylase family protein [Natranaerobius thermophilus]ACB84535.1 polysaccharide deacetylase [Natranaerobius thermophilus JW/NM-WN-LF]